MVLSCPKCGQALGEVPANGRLNAICARCRLQYEVVRGRVAVAESRQIIVRAATKGQAAMYGQQQSVRVELASGRAEVVDFELPDANAPLVARRGDVFYSIYLMRGARREQLLSVHNTTTGSSLTLSLPGEKATTKAWLFAGGIAAVVFVTTIGAGLSPLLDVGLAVGSFVGLGIGLGHQFMPRAEISPEEAVQLTAAQTLLAEKLNLETARAHAVQALASRQELRERVVALRAKMLNVGLDIYQPRIAVLDRAIALMTTQLELDGRLRDGYERSIQMIEIEIEAGATADAVESVTAPHITANLAAMRDLEEQQAELVRQLQANSEVEALLKGARM
jgi:hypothetical protein